MDLSPENEEYIRLYKGSLIPLKIVLVSLVWVLHDYFVTLEDEIRYIWSQKPSFGRFMFFWIRYYTIALLIFDVLQIHGFAIPGVATKDVCVKVDPAVRLVGAISLWSVEIIMQLRVYALFGRSRKIALFNAILFIVSIAFFIWIMVLNARNRENLIAKAVRFPLPGCPTINGGSQWAQWIPPTIYELVLFLFVLYKAITSPSACIKLNERISLTTVLLSENTVYFFCIAVLLIFNNLMVVPGATKIPWFGLAPFHAAVGILTSRMLIHLRKFTIHNLDGDKTPGRTVTTQGGLAFDSFNISDLTEVTLMTATHESRYDEESMIGSSESDDSHNSNSTSVSRSTSVSSRTASTLSTVAPSVQIRFGEPGPSRLHINT